MRLSYCVVNTNGRELLLTGLEAIRANHPAGLEAEVLVLDNASDDGSADAVRAWARGAGNLGEGLRLIELDRRTGKAANDTLLLRESRGTYSLLLNEDSELCPGAVEALVSALDDRPGAAAAGAQLLAPDGSELACAWRLPGIGTSVAQALFLHRVLVTESGGSETREVGWVQSAAMLVRGEAAERVGYLDPAFFVYSDETDFCKSLRDAGNEIVHVPAARAIHHEQLANDRVAGRRRTVEFHRGRDLYMQKHHGRAAAAVARVLAAWTYLPRALVSVFLPGRSPGWFLMHARYALRPNSGDGLREAAASYNAKLAGTRDDVPVDHSHPAE